jgi:P4 family phage/plasmid primase-like protien
MTTLQIFQSHPLWHFLQQHPANSGREATITGMGELTGRWHIPDQDYPRFLDLLHEYLFVQKHRPLGFVEQPRLNAPKPLLIDLDFHYPKTQAIERQFTEEQIRAFCHRIAQAYEHFFDMSVYDTLRFFVTLRPQPYADKDKIKDGIHILCPDAPLTNDKWKVLRAFLLSQNVISEIFGTTRYQNRDEDVFDPSMGRKQGWMFYGASKPSVPAYKLTNVFAYTPESQEWQDDEADSYTNRQLLELMSVRYRVEDDINVVKDGRKDDFDGFLNPIQPRYEAPNDAVVNQAATATALNDPLVNALAAMLPQAEGEQNLLRNLVMECLSEDRAESHDEWMRVGWCLHNIAKTREMFDLWMDFTKEKCPTKWNSHRAAERSRLERDWFQNMRMEGDGVRLHRRSLYKWARDDNLQRYNEIINANVCEFILTQTDTTHYHIASLMKKMWESLYVASVNSKTTEWYYYDEMLNMWRKLNQGMELRQKICIDVANKIQDACNIAGHRFTRAQGTEKEQYAKQMKDLHEMQMKLYNSGFNDSIMKMCSILFFEEEFASKLNVNPLLLGCANGVLELRHKNSHETQETVIFRQGRPEDYLSFLVGKNHPELPAIPYTPYEDFVNANDPRLAEIDDFFVKLFPRADLRKHVLKLLAACLEGGNPEQLFYFFTGVGSNGKSRLVKLMEFTFGDYQTQVQSTIFTRKRPESGSANPDLIVLKGKRFISSAEPDDKESLNTSRMKQMSGEDLIEARPLYGDQERFKVMGRIFMLCNNLPPINSMDNGTWRRVRVIPFESQFKDPTDPDYIAQKPNVFLKDSKLDARILTWREPFLSLLVHIYETEYLVNGLHPEPAIIKQESEKYKADHDSFAKFRSERIRELKHGYPEVTNEKVTLKEIVKAYNRWLVSGGGKKMDTKELENRCEEAFGDSRGKREYSHIRVFLDDEDLEEFEKQHAESLEAS